MNDVIYSSGARSSVDSAAEGRLRADVAGRPDKKRRRKVALKKMVKKYY